MTPADNHVLALVAILVRSLGGVVVVAVRGNEGENELQTVMMPNGIALILSKAKSPARRYGGFAALRPGLN